MLKYKDLCCSIERSNWATVKDYFFEIVLNWNDGLVVEQWSCNREVPNRNQDHALVPFGKALVLVSKSVREEFKPSVPWLLTYQHTHDFLAVE